MKKLKFYKLKKLFTAWSRKKVIITIFSVALIAIAGIGGYAIYHQRAGADTLRVASANASNLIEVQLPKNLADKAKQQDNPAQKFSDAENTTIDGLVKQEMDKKIPVTNSGVTRQASTIDSEKDNFQDAIIILKDENGKAILPDLEKLKTQSASSRAESDIPESNKISFIIGDGWTQGEKQAIQKVVDENVPKMREILGPPLFNTEVKINHAQGNGISAGNYDANRNIINVSSTFVLDTVLVHEMAHAWRDDYILVAFNNSQSNYLIEEAMATFITEYLTDFFGYGFMKISDYPLNSPSVNTAIVSSIKTFPYDYSYRTIAKMFIEDRDFLKKFHNQLYKYRTGTTESVKNFMKNSLPSKMYGVATKNWLDSQYLLFPNEAIKPGAGFVFFGKVGVGDLSNGLLYYYIKNDGSFTLFNAKDEMQIKFFNSAGKNYYQYKDYGSLSQDAPMVKHFYIDAGAGNGFTKIEVEDNLNNKNSSYQLFDNTIGSSTLAFSDKVNIGNNGEIIMHANQSGKTEIIPLSKDMPNATDGLFDDTDIRTPDTLWDKFRQDTFLNSVEFNYSCPIFNEQDKVYIDTIAYGGYDFRLYLNPSAELKNNTKPSITVKSTGDQKWTVNTNEKSAITATIANARSQTIKTITDKQIIDSQLPITWDGKDDSGKPMPKGSYILNISATDKLCLDNSKKVPFQLKSTATDTRTDAQKNDDQRKADLAKLKTAIDKYNTQNKKLPASDGWIASKDLPNANDSLAETLLPAKAIDKIPCDPANTAQDCASGITYQYWRGDYAGFGSTDQVYALYAKLDNPTKKDLATMNTGNAKMNAKAKEYGMNYLVGN